MDFLPNLALDHFWQMEQLERKYYADDIVDIDASKTAPLHMFLRCIL